MNEQVEVQGTLRPDGTLVLDEKPNLPEGRVKIVARLVTAPSPKPDALAVLDKIRAERKALSMKPRTAREIEAEIQVARDEWDER